MKGAIIMFCLIGAAFANPISSSAVLESGELDPNTTESLSVSQSAENNTSELQSSEENTSSQSQSQSSESESLESTSEAETSEESDSQSDEDEETDSMAETRDDSMGSEENMRQSWVRLLASVTKVHSAEDNSSSSSSAEVRGQPEQLTELRLGNTTDMLLTDGPTDSSDTTSDSADTTELTAAASSQSTSSESDETSETSETSEASDSSDASDSSELQHVKTHDCVNGTQSCESEEDFFQVIGDDTHYSVDHLMVPEEDERELSLRR